MHWFIDPIKTQYLDFDGRATRQQYWMYILWYILIYIGIGFVGVMVGLEELALLFSLAVLMPGLAITARRLHDINKSGWWQLISFVPLLGLIVMIVFTVKKGDQEANQYGASPYGGADSEPDTVEREVPQAPEAMMENE